MYKLYRTAQKKHHMMNETETRAHLIDPALKEAGWGVVEGSRVRMELECISKTTTQG